MATVVPFDPTLHERKSYSRKGGCGQGGSDTCFVPAVWSVTSDKGRVVISSCDKHLGGAVRWVRSQEEALLRYEFDRDTVRML
jgi:hypothetical protein